MKEINLEKYFSEIEVEFSNYAVPAKLNTILAWELDMDPDGIRDFLDSCVVTITEDEIKEYLNKKFEEDNLELKERLEKSVDNEKENGMLDAEVATQKFMDKLQSAKYMYDPKQYQYLCNYINIVKNRTSKLLYVVDSIIKYEIYDDNIKEQLFYLDIKMNDIYIHHEDVHRLLKPLIFNIRDLKETIEVANNLDTYLDFNKAISNLNINNPHSIECPPTDKLQINEIMFHNYPGYVALSKEQYKKLEKKEEKNYEKVLKMIKNIF